MTALDQVSPVQRLKITMLTTLGVLTAGALIGGCIVFLVDQRLIGETPSSADWFGVMTFGGLSIVIAAIALRASARTKRGAVEGESLAILARLSPALLAVGALLGAYASHRIALGHVASMHSIARMDCERIFRVRSREPLPNEIDRCEPIALACEIEDLRRRSAESSQGAHIQPDFENSPLFACVTSRLGL